MDLVCYLHPGWAPLIRPAPVKREWMDNTPDSFAYRCLPLNIANAHGWEILCPCAFDALWNGEAGTGAVTICPDPSSRPEQRPVSLFGNGVVTFHVEGIIRTPPGWNLWVGGSPNRAKDGISPLTAIVESDWSPFTFTMNWRFTRPGQWVHFHEMEPFCFFFPVERAAVEEFHPRFESLDSDPATSERFRAWSLARDEFHQKMRVGAPPSSSADHWQKHYYRGTDVNGEALIGDHRVKLRLKSFNRNAAPGVPIAPADDKEMPPDAGWRGQADRPDDIGALRKALAKREWLLESLENQRDLAPMLVGIERRTDLSSEEFLERYYASNRPVILAGEMANWPALARWTPEYLKAKVGSRLIEYQGDRSSDRLFEMNKDVHRREAPFDSFIDRILEAGADNDAYLTAYNSARNAEALSPLYGDLGFLDKFLDRSSEGRFGMMWIGPAGTVTSLHHDLTNNFIAQLAGRKRVKLHPASEAGKLYNSQHVFSDIPDLEDPGIDLDRYPRLNDLRSYDVVLEPGDIIFMPLGWWHQVRSLDFSVTVTYTNFLWRNDYFRSYPSAEPVRSP